MENSPTDGSVETTGLPQEPTSTGQQEQSAEQNQETNSREQSQESVSDDAAQQTNTNTQNEKGSDSTTDDGLAKFAKSQGVDDVSKLTDNELRFLKIAHDNQKAFREKGNQPSITDASKSLSGTDVEARLAQLEYEKIADNFFGQNRDRNLEPQMVEILNEKAEQYGKDYAFNLSRDLDALYGLAQVRAGNVSSVDTEAIRREERESIQRQMSANAPAAHATSGSREPSGKIDQDWIANQYDPRNPEHRKMVDEYYRR